MGVIIITVLILHVVIAKVIASTVITPVTDTSTSYLLDKYDESSIKEYNNCGCIQFDCGCCQYIVWNAVSLNGTLCVNVSYLEHEYGISVTVTYNDFAIINETVSARNPPPICFGENIVDSLQVEICLHIYDIDIQHDIFHACFEIFGKFMHIKLLKIKLGCVNTMLQKQLEHVENKFFYQLLRKKKTEDFKVPNVVMV